MDRLFEKVVVITNIPNPYRIPLFNELNTQLQKKGLKLKVVFGALERKGRKWDIDLKECKFDFEVLNLQEFSRSSKINKVFTYTGLMRLINKEKPNVIITPGFSSATVKLWIRSFFFSIPYIIWSGSIRSYINRDSIIKRNFRKVLIKRAKGFIAYGKKAHEYLIYLGAERSRISIGINTVDTKFFSEETKRRIEHLNNDERKKHLLTAGYLIPRKNLIKILEVVKKLSKERSDFVLDIVGDGDDRIRLEGFVKDNDMNDIVKFHGFKHKNEIPGYLAKASCFLFQTDFDIWGLVLNEAMAAGLPCIASIRAGATHDLVKDGINGFAVDFCNSNKVIERINLLLNNPELSIKMGKNASCYIANHVNLEKSAEGFIKAIELAL